MIPLGSPSQTSNQEPCFIMSSLNELAGDLSPQALPGCHLQVPQTSRVERLETSAASKGATPARGGLAPKVADRIRVYIEDHIDERISVEMLASLANLSVCYFVRAFKLSMGITPHDYLMRRRVEHTMQLLLATNMPLSEIAVAAGFTDQSHCARRFRRHTGMSPSAYRWRTPLS